MVKTAAWRSHINQSIIISLLILLLSGCDIGQQRDSAYPTVHTKMLLLDARAFPATWQTDVCTIGCDRTERQFYSLRTFGRPAIAGQVVQQVYAYPETKQAVALFQNHREAEIPSGVFITPTESTYRSPLADEQAVGCDGPQGYVCKAFFRYRNYVVEFTVDIAEGSDLEGMEIRNIDPIMEDMDRTAAKVLGATAPKSNP